MKKRSFLLCFFLITSLVYSQNIPSPEDYLGFAVGTDRKMADWKQIVGYFQELDQASERLSAQVVGSTTEGRPFLLVTIAEPQTIQNLEKYRQIQMELADPRIKKHTLDELVKEGKTVVLITCAVHATEVASAQMSMEFAWEMATRADEETQEILRNAIFLFVPSLNPDGLDLVHSWYQQTLGTPAEGTSPPQLYHKYVGHDNNRDWYMFTQAETRVAVSQIHNRWHPQIVYDVHQMGSTGARMFVPPFIDPVDPNVDPILQAQIVDLGGTMFSALLTAGRKGIVTNAIYDAFTPARAYQHYHAGVRILSESASARLATPIVIEPEELREGRNYDAREPSWNFPVVWEGGKWGVRDIMEDQKIAFRALLLHAARFRQNWLRNFYQVGVNALNQARPFAFVIPPAAEQRDPEALHDLLRVLEFGLVEIQLAQSDFEVFRSKPVSLPLGKPDKTRFPAGSFVVSMNQPYSSFAKTMLEVQDYPRSEEYPGGPPKRPYDVTAHTLGIQLGVEVYQLDDPFEVALEAVETVDAGSARIEGEGKFWLFSHTNNSFSRLANRLLRRQLPVFWAPNGFQVQGKGFQAGTLAVRVGKEQRNIISAIEDLPVEVKRVGKWPELAWQRIRQPKIGLYKSYAASMDEGWTRWILEDYEFPYESLSDKTIREGKLSSYDAIVLPDQSLAGLKDGLSEPYPEEFRGGLGDAGLGSLERFVRRGGTLVLMGDSTEVAVTDWDLGVRNVLDGLPGAEFYVPGSLLRARVHSRHPIGLGMNDETALMFLRSPAFEITRGVSVVEFPEADLLLSGWINGEDHLYGKTALADIELGKGRVILIGFRTQFRAQARGTYKFLFNSLYYSTLRN